MMIVDVGELWGSGGRLPNGVGHVVCRGQIHSKQKRPLVVPDRAGQKKPHALRRTLADCNAPSGVALADRNRAPNRCSRSSDARLNSRLSIREPDVGFVQDFGTNRIQRLGGLENQPKTVPLPLVRLLLDAHLLDLGVKSWGSFGVPPLRLDGTKRTSLVSAPFGEDRAANGDHECETS